MSNVASSINRHPGRRPGALFRKPAATALALVRRHLPRPVKRPAAGGTERLRPVARPEKRTALRKALYAHPMLDQTADGKQIFLVRYARRSPVIREIGRLREVAFRAVAEGTGRGRDLDRYDLHYGHIVLWDDDDSEIVGAYRVADSAAVIREHGLQGLYTRSLFRFEPSLHRYLARGLELGRSFVQPRYWGRRGLDYLWYGIGAYLRAHPHIRYLFGPVTLSGALPEEAKDLLVGFYRTHFPSSTILARARLPFNPIEAEAARFPGQDYPREFKQLKQRLELLGTGVPALYKQYTELCEPGGARFLDFGIDPGFSDCVDGLVLIDTRLIKPRKWERYVGTRRAGELNKAA